MWSNTQEIGWSKSAGVCIRDQMGDESMMKESSLVYTVMFRRVVAAMRRVRPGNLPGLSCLGCPACPARPLWR